MIKLTLRDRILLLFCAVGIIVLWYTGDRSFLETSGALLTVISVLAIFLVTGFTKFRVDPKLKKELDGKSEDEIIKFFRSKGMSEEESKEAARLLAEKK